MKRYLIPLLPIPLLALILLLMNQTTPVSMGPAGILLMFSLIYILFISIFFNLVIAGSNIAVKFGTLSRDNEIKPYKAYYFSCTLACFPVFILAIVSIGELGIADVMLVALFVLLASFYVARKL
ncbi:hypothetical protein CYG49_04690 [Candidatus Saccharibacteria bacterium]|nr:MAG: hypothetical protein CYG49_04690 [Candidatus Saccharibacteria bacterium]